MICPYLNKTCRYDFMSDICQNCRYITFDEISRQQKDEGNKKTDCGTDALFEFLSPETVDFLLRCVIILFASQMVAYILGMVYNQKHLKK